MINRISSWALHILSLFAMALVVGPTALTKIGKLKPSHDEGTAAHLFQIAVALLVPAGLVFLLSADWRKPVRVGLRLLAPAIALVIAFATLYYMEHVFRR
jgi:hypothetical protein